MDPNIVLPANYKWAVSERGRAYEFDEEQGILRLYYGTLPTLEAWTAALLQAASGPRFPSSIGILGDRRGVGPPSTEFVKGAVSFLRTHRDQFEHTRWVMVISDPASFGMERMAQAMLDDVAMTLAVFRDLDEAEDWLRQPWLQLPN